jgi:hypothetical protein
MFGKYFGIFYKEYTEERKEDSQFNDYIFTSGTFTMKFTTCKGRSYSYYVSNVVTGPPSVSLFCSIYIYHDYGNNEVYDWYLQCYRDMALF